MDWPWEVYLGFGRWIYLRKGQWLAQPLKVVELANKLSCLRQCDFNQAYISKNARGIPCMRSPGS
jgi:hypothetical protein